MRVKQWWNFFGTIIMGSAILWTAAYCLGTGCFNITLGLFSTEWPVSPGKIVRSSVKSVHSNAYCTDVEYEYSVNGIALRGKRVYFGDAGSSANPLRHRIIVEKFPVGKSVSVRYWPWRSSVCVLEPDIHSQAWFAVGMGLLFLMLGVIFSSPMYKALKQPWQNKAMALKNN